VLDTDCRHSTNRECVDNNRVIPFKESIGRVIGTFAIQANLYKCTKFRKFLHKLKIY
jgi:hypothetical protein